ncbi:class I SAM-dependent methyltransferase [Candidatus Latescibacterota bacterium]
MDQCVQNILDYTIMICNKCGFYGINLDGYKYPYLDHDYYPCIRPDMINPGRPHIRYRIKQVMKFVSKGRAVDLGCGLGETAIALQHAGFEVDGVDESKKAIEFLRQNFSSIKWHNNKIEDFLTNNKNFDVIAMYHILEHIPNPHFFCSIIHESMHQNGLLIIEVPDVGGGLARLRGWSWHHWNQHHVNYFSLSTLCRLLKPLNFRLEHVELKYHLCYPQGIKWRDMIHGLLVRLGLNDIIVTYWRKLS